MSSSLRKKNAHSALANGNISSLYSSSFYFISHHLIFFTFSFSKPLLSFIHFSHCHFSVTIFSQDHYLGALFSPLIGIALVYISIYIPLCLVYLEDLVLYSCRMTLLYVAITDYQELLNWTPLKLNHNDAPSVMKSLLKSSHEYSLRTMFMRFSFTLSHWTDSMT